MVMRNKQMPDHHQQSTLRELRLNLIAAALLFGVVVAGAALVHCLVLS
jgi:hypothetical protein